MTEKKYCCIDEDEYNSYWIADTSKADKTKEDFWDEDEEIYHIFEFEEYLRDNGAVLKGDEVVDLLNALDTENQQLRILTKSLKTQNQKLKLRLEDLGVEYL